MTRTLRLTRLGAVALLAALLAAPGVAGASTIAEYELQYAPATGYSLMIVTIVADPQATLPVTVAVPVPAGATVLWSGEVLGGATDDDPVRETTKETVGDMDVYTMTLEQSYTAQVELQLPAATASGSRLGATLTWTNPGEEGPVSAAVIIPAGATDVELSPAVAGETSTNEAGETLYPLTGARLAQGAAVTIEASWATGGSEAAPGAGSATLPALLGLLVSAGVALVIVLVRERTRARRIAADTAGV
jgi:hypothetical protein